MRISRYKVNRIASGAGIQHPCSIRLPWDWVTPKRAQNSVWFSRKCWRIQRICSPVARLLCGAGTLLMIVAWSE